MLVGVLGVWLAIANPNDAIFSLLWVQLALGLFAFALAVVLLLQGPLARRAARRLLTLAARPADQENAGLAKKLAFDVWALEALTAVSAVGLIGMLVLMIAQPS